MLGLSLFSFGSSVGREGAEQAPKRAKQVRRREQEEVQPEVQLVANIAEEEAKAVIVEQQMETDQQLMQTQDLRLSNAQLAVRVAAVAVWTFGAAVFFGSMVFNYPFSLGKAALSLLPGTPHIATLRLSAEKNVVEQGENITVDVQLDSNTEPVEAAKLLLTYDPALLKFQGFNLEKEFFPQAHIDTGKAGAVSLILEPMVKPVEIQQRKIAQVHFVALKKSEPAAVGIDQDQSAVLSLKNGKREDILGAVFGVEFKITEVRSWQLNCRKLEEQMPPADGSVEEYWKNFGKGDILPNSKIGWMDISEKSAFVCAQTDEQGYFYVYSEAAAPNKVVIHSNQQELAVGKEGIIASWQEDRRNFAVFQIPQEWLARQNITVDFIAGSGEKIVWPEQGTANIKFE